MSGYDIKKALEGSAAAFWAESYGQIYPILRRLADEGLVRPEKGAAEAARGRRVFAVTARGREALDSWLVEPTEPTNPRHEFLLKLFFGKRVPVADLRKQIERHRAKLQEFLDDYEEMRRGLEQSFPEAEDLPFWQITLRYGERSRRADIDWCNETLEEIARIEKQRARKEKTGGSGRRRKGGTT